MITKAQLQYLGAVRTPPEAFARGGMPASIDFERREYIVGTRDFRVGRLRMTRPQSPVGITRPHNGLQVLDVKSVPVAPWANAQGGALSDPSGGTWRELNQTDTAADGALAEVLPLGNHALVAGSIYYDASATQDVSFFVCEWPLPTDRPAARTRWKSIKNLGEGWAAGPMTIIPSRFRDALKGDVLFGQPGGLPIISRQSFGPCAISAYARDFFEFDDVPATLLLGYHLDELVAYGKNPNNWWNSATTYTALTFVGDWLWFIGNHGYGAPCYGTGEECGDPTGAAKGTHAYPYRVQALAYRVADLADVAAGRKKYNDLRPVDWLPLELPYFENTNYEGLPAGAQPRLDVVGADFDSEACELHVCTHMQDSIGWDPGPLWHVIKINGLAPSPNALLRLEPAKPNPVPEPEPDPGSDTLAELERLRREVVAMHQELTTQQQELVLKQAAIDRYASMLEGEKTAHKATTDRIEMAMHMLRTLREALQQIQDWRP
jgi:hypothetical protein